MGEVKGTSSVPGKDTPMDPRLASRLTSSPLAFLSPVDDQRHRLLPYIQRPLREAMRAHG